MASLAFPTVLILSTVLLAAEALALGPVLTFRDPGEPLTRTCVDYVPFVEARIHVTVVTGDTSLSGFEFRRSVSVAEGVFFLGWDFPGAQVEIEGDVVRGSLDSCIPSETQRDVGSFSFVTTTAAPDLLFCLDPAPGASTPRVRECEGGAWRCAGSVERETTPVGYLGGRTWVWSCVAARCSGLDLPRRWDCPTGDVIPTGESTWGTLKASWR